MGHPARSQGTQENRETHVSKTMRRGAPGRTVEVSASGDEGVRGALIEGLTVGGGLSGSWLLGLLRLVERIVRVELRLYLIRLTGRSLGWRLGRRRWNDARVVGSVSRAEDVGVGILFREFGFVEMGVERGGPGVAGSSHGDIDIFEDFAGSDALQAVGRFDQVVAGDSVVLAAERIGEDEGSVELSGLDQETRAVDLPKIGRAAHCVDPRGEGCEATSLELGAASSFMVRPRAGAGCRLLHFATRVWRMYAGWG